MQKTIQNKYADLRCFKLLITSDKVKFGCTSRKYFLKIICYFD